MGTLKKIIFFIIANAFVVGFFFFAPEYPVFSIAALVLGVTNLLCILLVKAWPDRDISEIDTNVSGKAVKTSIRILRYAASSLAIISFITTAEGLQAFVFTGTGGEWQSYLASFAVQSILMVFNFLFFHLYIRINRLDGFPQFFKRILTYLMVLLLLVALTISSTFSFVFIANNTHEVTASAAEQTVYIGGMSAGFTLKTEGAQIIGLSEVITDSGVSSPAAMAMMFVQFSTLH